MCRKAINSRSVFASGFVVVFICSTLSLALPAAGQDVKRINATEEDHSLQCIDALQGKRTLASPAIDSRLHLDPCPNSQTLLQNWLNLSALRLFDAGGFAYLIPSKFFPPLPAGFDAHWPQAKWQDIKISYHIKAADGMTEEKADRIGREVIRQARLIPLEVDLSQQGSASVQFSVFLFDLKLATTSGARSIIALINQLPYGSAGRFVYGEMRDDHYVMLWDSPLFHAVGNPEFKDVNGDGVDEIVMQSHLCGNGCQDHLVIFDKAGRELTRQSECSTKDYAWVCDISGADVSLEDVAGGTKVIQLSGADDGKDHTYILHEGGYVHADSSGGSSQPPDNTGARLNGRGMQLMRQGNYQSAAALFVEAAAAAGTKGSSFALFSNNAGFAYFKMDQYQDSVDWFKKAIEIDPNRAIAYLNLGDAYAKLKRNSEARQAYTKYLELAPSSKSAPDVKKKVAALPPAP